MNGVLSSLKSLTGNLGRKSHAFFGGLSQISSLLKDTFYWAFIAPFRKKGFRANYFFYQMVRAGVDSIPIVALVCASVGVVLALQSAYQLKRFGALMYTGGLVSVSMARELGPLIAAIVISGRVGASIAAELGTMKVSEEIDALKTMGLNPIQFLIVPRFLALLIMVPCLTILADFIGMLGGYMIGTLTLGIDPNLYIQKSIDSMVLKDINTGLIKSFFFAIIIGIVSCFEGFSVEGGAEGVGKSTTAAVVMSIVLIIVSDCLFTAMFYYVFP